MSERYMFSELETLAKCPSCNSDSKNIYLSEDRLPIEICNNCGLIFVNPRPSEDSIRSMFSNEYIDTIDRVEEGFVSFRKLSLSREASLVKKILSQGGSLLDLGTASGEFLYNFIGDKRWRLKGIEPSKFAAEYARKNTDATIYTGFIDDYDFKHAEFNIITSLDAFYFHPNPNKDLKIINKILKVNGFFMIEIPNFKFRLFKNTGLISKLLYGKSSQLNAGVHLFYYDKRSLTSMLERNGFKFLSSHSEQSPTYGNKSFIFLNNLYFFVSKFLYKATKGKVNIAPKEILIYQKNSDIN